MADLQVPPAVGSSGQRLDTIVINVASTIYRQTVVIGDPSSSGALANVSSGGHQWIVSASSGVVQVLTTGTYLVTGTMSLSSGTVTLSSAPVVQSASSGIVQTVQSTTQTYNVYQINNSSSNSITNVQTSAVILYGWNVGNQSTGLAQAIKIYNTTSAPTIGSTALLKVTIPIPGSTAGAGNNMMLGQGIALSAGLSFTITNNFAATSTGTSASAGDIVGQLYYI